MWVQKDMLTKERGRNEVLDWVVIDGVLWVEIIDDRKETEICIVQC